MIRRRKLLVVLVILVTAALTLFFLEEEDAIPVSFVPIHHGQVEYEEISTPATSKSHPIHQLVAEAEQEFKKVQARQSKTLEEAVIEYRRRYGMPPPPNFDKWYNFAKRQGVQLIDEFDTIHHSLLPFWATEPYVLRERTRQAIGFNNAMIGVLIRDGEVTKMDGGGEMYAWHRAATPIMLKRFIRYLPDMDLAFNIHDEPRVVMQHDELFKHVDIAQKENIPRAFNTQQLRNSWSPRPDDVGPGDRIKDYKTTRFNVFAHQPTWSNSRISCPPDSAARACLNDSCPDNRASYTSLPLGFIQNTTAFSDICNSPSFESTYGFFDRPNAFDVAHELIPVFSQSKVSSFQDILYPSPWYFMGRVKPDPDHDMGWEAKKPNMFWRGSTTGGFSRDGGWRRQHRQRFIQKVQPVGNATILQYDTKTDPADPMWVTTKKQMSEIPPYFDVKFTFVGQCDPGDCDAQREFFDLAEPVNMFDALESRYLLDIDGNAFSGRYYAWLLSNSLVFKLALFREWHDEWLRPWVHYVPLSLKGDEYVEAIRYFEEEETGREIAKKLADQGKDWAEKVLRNEDLEVWYFRLLLEYGRLVDDDRYNIGFTI